MDAGWPKFVDFNLPAVLSHIRHGKCRKVEPGSIDSTVPDVDLAEFHIALLAVRVICIIMHGEVDEGLGDHAFKLPVALDHQQIFAIDPARVFADVGTNPLVHLRIFKLQPCTGNIDRFIVVVTVSGRSPSPILVAPRLFHLHREQLDHRHRPQSAAANHLRGRGLRHAVSKGLERRRNGSGGFRRHGRSIRQPGKRGRVQIRLHGANGPGIDVQIERHRELQACRLLAIRFIHGENLFSGVGDLPLQFERPRVSP